MSRGETVTVTLTLTKSERLHPISIFGATGYDVPIIARVNISPP